MTGSQFLLEVAGTHAASWNDVFGELMLVYELCPLF